MIKCNLNLMDILLGLFIVIVPLTASADVLVPHTFASGSPAVASEVNANFQAFNTRQTATLPAMAGTYSFQMIRFSTITTSISGNPTFNTTCAYQIQGTMTLTSGGNATATTTSINNFGGNNCVNDSPGTLSGTYTVNADGSGTITVPGITFNFKASKDLNTVLFQTSDNQGVAIRN
jgi:hypothetical protein